jgi:flagellar basal body rod protein FlgC
MTNPINGPRNALNISLQGMKREEVRVAQAAADIQNAFTSAQNAQAADSVAVNADRAAVVPAVEDAVRGAVLPAAGDISAAIVNLLQASTAYKANAAAARVTADIETEATKLLRR